jgi:hypothetical protein
VQEDFKRILQQRYSLEQLAEWIFHLATRFLMVRCLATQWYHVRALTRSHLVNTQGTDMMQVMDELRTTAFAQVVLLSTTSS